MRVQSQIEAKLRAALLPTHLEIENESHRHSVAPGSESHFKVIVVSPRFEGLLPVQRQRLVYDALAAELAAGLHALTMKTLTPAQFAAAGGQVELTSPACRGGSKAD